jgi:4-hydroxyproline epimerase
MWAAMPPHAVVGSIFAYNTFMSDRSSTVSQISVLDSHTAGEPTRVVMSGGPDIEAALGLKPLAERRELLRTQFDNFRRSVILEPRGSEVVVGALLCKPTDPAAATGVIFFNDVGYLGMCGHGTIGVVTTLAHLGVIEPGLHLIETPVGNVRTELHTDLSVSVENVRSYRDQANVSVDVPGHGRFTGDVAWGGNWFFLIGDHGYDLQLANRSALVAVTVAIRASLSANGITGRDGSMIDHIELFSAPDDPVNSSRNFVLCPGTSFDRSPCGTGTSAKMACLFADGKLSAGELWRQEGILGSVFTGSVQPDGEGVIPTITGRAWMTAQSTLLFDATDPFREGIHF